MYSCLYIFSLPLPCYIVSPRHYSPVCYTNKKHLKNIWRSLYHSSFLSHPLCISHLRFSLSLSLLAWKIQKVESNAQSTGSNPLRNHCSQPRGSSIFQAGFAVPSVKVSKSSVQQWNVLRTVHNCLMSDKYCRNDFVSFFWLRCTLKNDYQLLNGNLI